MELFYSPDRKSADILTTSVKAGMSLYIVLPAVMTLCFCGGKTVDTLRIIFFDLPFLLWAYVVSK